MTYLYDFLQSKGCSSHAHRSQIKHGQSPTMVNDSAKVMRADELSVLEELQQDVTRVN